jgi:hypothetical protein
MFICFYELIISTRFETIRAHKGSQKSRHLAAPYSGSRYINSCIPKPISKNLVKGIETFCYALVTHCDKFNGDIYIQPLRYIDSNGSSHNTQINELLEQLEQDFEKMFEQEQTQEQDQNSSTPSDNLAELRLFPTSLSSTYRLIENEPCVCRLNKKYFRCIVLNRSIEIQNQQMSTQYNYQIIKDGAEQQASSTQLTSSIKQLVWLRAIDFGFDILVDIENIYRPLIKHLQIAPLAIRLRLSFSTNEEIKSEFPSTLPSILCGRIVIVKIKSTSINDDLLLLGDVCERNLNAWLTDHFNFFNDIVDPTCYKEINLTSYLTPNIMRYKSLEMPSEDMIVLRDIVNKCNYYKVVITWIEQNYAWLQFVSAETINQGSQLERFQEELIEMKNSKTLIQLDMIDIVIGMPCLSYYGDGLLYRAIVLDIDYINRIARVKYIDYGNEESVSINM